MASELDIRFASRRSPDAEPFCPLDHADSRDLSMRGYNGTLNGSPSFSSSALNLDGTDDFVEFSTFPNFAPPFSVSIWYYGDAAQTTRASIFAKALSTGFQGWYLHLFYSTFIIFYINQSGSQYRGVGASGTFIGRWTHICVTCSSFVASDIKIYLNGVLAGTGTDSAGSITSISTSSTLKISNKTSSNQGDSFIKASVDNAMFFSRALSAAEVLTIFNAGRTI